MGQYPGIDNGRYSFGWSYPQFPPSGLLGNMSTSLYDYVGIRGRVRNQNGLLVQEMCASEVFFLGPIFEYRNSSTAVQQELYDFYGFPNFVSGFEFDALNAPELQVAYKLYYNKLLTRGRDILPLMNMVSTALWRTLDLPQTAAVQLPPLPTLGGALFS